MTKLVYDSLLSLKTDSNYKIIFDKASNLANKYNILIPIEKKFNRTRKKSRVSF